MHLMLILFMLLLNDITEDNLAFDDVTFIHAIADEGKPAFLRQSWES